MAGPTLRETPVVIGIGDVKNRSPHASDAREPADLMLQAIQVALADAAASASKPTTTPAGLQAAIDSVDIVRNWTWPYSDLPSLLCEKLGLRDADVKHKFESEHSGDKPAKLFDGAARRVAKGECMLAVVTGAEALASLSAFAAAKKLPPPGWTTPDRSVESVFSPTTRSLRDGIGANHSVGAPIHVYPMYENGFRAHRHQSIEDNWNESAQMYAEYAKIAERNPHAWNYGKPAEAAQSIGTVSKKNRMICFPYPLLMNAFNSVNLSAACVLTSASHARELGIPEDRWIYPLGGAGTQDHIDFWERPNFYSSPAISRSLDAALEASGLDKDQVDLFDFYSCFPIVPKIACQHFNLPVLHPPKPITLLGGLTSFGGAGNNYSMHAITAMIRALRASPNKSARISGLVLANGGNLTYQFAVCFSTKPRMTPDGAAYPEKNPLPPKITDVRVPRVDAHAEGEAVLETYTVEFGRDGSPLRAYVVGRLKSNGHRFVANHGDSSTLQHLISKEVEPIGRSGWVRVDEEDKRKNLFSFEGARL
ncbi:hypothetical protein BDY21DRAFT_323764 [Lineolata rhizophorae]|uniref:Thiolase-like protein type 1 additional C-terminal domain-containing protein n=1 Tax=Lineolata rhizophorae TaxID=578093 RepID=A0A6A6NWQ2_9PEZI|nr:hypothetical protein BDY21DRAFT_323764 [Lineolata rhizophorae]